VYFASSENASGSAIQPPTAVTIYDLRSRYRPMQAQEFAHCNREMLVVDVAYPGRAAEPRPGIWYRTTSVARKSWSRISSSGSMRTSPRP